MWVDFTKMLHPSVVLKLYNRQADLKLWIHAISNSIRHTTGQYKNRWEEVNNKQGFSKAPSSLLTQS